MSAVVDARKMIVEGAVGMVEMALEELSASRWWIWTMSARRRWFQPDGCALRRKGRAAYY